MQQLGKYQLIRKLATGGMAEVFLAKAAGPMGFEKTLVVKRILPHLAEAPAFVEMFLGEAKLAARLNHPHIVQIFDFGEADGEYFLAMEYIDGPHLRLLLKRSKAAGMPLPPALCARLITAACEGLAFAHDSTDPATGEPLGLIHRDISPDNILVSRQGAVKVVDFGIAKAAGQSHKTETGIVKGKLAYMPPEQLRARPLDRRVDVYALGVVLYELLTTHRPFEAPTEASLVQAILFEPMVPALHHRPDLPETLQRILDRALAKDREQRYPDCLALAADLEEFILSVGKPVTTQQIVQLIAQVVPNTDTPVPTPQPGTPRSDPGSGPKVLENPRTQDVTAPQRPSTKEASAPTLPHTFPEVTAVTEQEAPVPFHPPRRWPFVALGGTILLAVAVFLFWRGSSTPAPATAPAVAQLSTPAPASPTPKAPPPPPSAPVAEATPPGPMPSTEPPADSGEKKDSEEPLKVAEATPPPSPIKRDRRPKPAPSKQSSSSAKAKSTGTIVFRVFPFAEVFIDNKRHGQTPIDPVELPPGEYKLKLVNDELKKTARLTVKVKAGETETVKINLEEL